MGGKRGESRCDMLPNIEKATVCRLKRNGLKRKVCRLKRNGGSMILNISNFNCILKSFRQRLRLCLVHLKFSDLNLSDLNLFFLI